MKIAGKETKFMFIPYLVMYIDENEYLYYFDDNKKLHIDFGPYAKLSPSKWNSLIGLKEHTIDEHYRVWTTIVELDEHEKAAFTEKRRHFDVRPQSYNSIRNRINNHKKYGSVRAPHKSSWEPRNDGKFDIDRFITRVDQPTVERDFENSNNKTFDFVMLRMNTRIAEEKPMEVIREHKQDILAIAVDKISKSKRFTKYGVSINFLKLDTFKYFDSIHEIELIFVLKDIPTEV